MYRAENGGREITQLKFIKFPVIIFVILLLFCGSAQAQQGKRIALLIGNKGYNKAIGALDNPHKDIELLASTLRGLGFRVMPLLKDAGRNAILGAIYDYTQALNKAGANSVGFFYYSGHGLAVDDANYIVPVDVSDLSVRSIRAGGLPLDRVTNDLKSQAPKTDHFVIFDACRNVRGVRGSKGFVPVQQRHGMLIAFSTAPGKTASDGKPNDPAGPYARILAEELKQPGQHEGNIFYNVRIKVAALGKDQIPRQRNGLLKRHYFAPRMSRDKINRIQKFLLELKYDPGIPDGLTGQKTRKAIMAFQKTYWGRGLVTGEVSENLLISLQTAVNGQRRFALMNRGKSKTSKPEQVLAQPAVGTFENIQPHRQRKPYEPETVFIPGGTFSMGCVSGKGCNDDEKPVHRVTVSKFYMSKYETTFAQWDACVQDGGCTHKPKDYSWGRGKRPVINVSWNDANEYAKWLSGKTGEVWRLPTEAEWEYAARAGTKTKYSFGNRITTAQANFGYKLQKTTKVGNYPANKFGLYDMHGNVWEWVSDRYSKDYYKKSPAKNPENTKSGSNRVIRGGGWFNGAGHLRSAFRNNYSPVNRDNDVGFRLMRQPS